MKHLVMIAALLAPGIAQAGWPEDTWSEETTRWTGSPAIAVHADGSVAVVLQSELLSLHRLDTSAAAKAFRDRRRATKGRSLRPARV